MPLYNRWRITKPLIKHIHQDWPGEEIKELQTQHEERCITEEMVKCSEMAKLSERLEMDNEMGKPCSKSNWITEYIDKYVVGR